MTIIQPSRLLILCLALCSHLTSAKSEMPPGVTPQEPGAVTIKFWNGNKTQSRQDYEREVLQAALDATQGAYVLDESRADYPRAEEEAAVFREKGFHIFGTVAGNQKLAQEEKVLIPAPLMKGLLGYRILIIRTADAKKFARIKSASALKQLRMGIPATWADAGLFRHNGYPVVEKGSFDELFTRLERGEFDYVTFGANEVASVFAERAAHSGKLMIEPSLLVYYPFPLVFYVSPVQPELARRVSDGLEQISKNGVLDKIFNRYYGDTLAQLGLPKRTRISLENPILPLEMADFAPAL